MQHKKQKIATNAAVDAAVAAGRAVAGALTPMTPAATQLPPSYRVIRTPAAVRLGSAAGGASAGGGGGTDGGGHPHPDAVGIWL